MKNVLIIANSEIAAPSESYRLYRVSPAQLLADRHKMEGVELDLILVLDYVRPDILKDLKHRLVRRDGMYLNLCDNSVCGGWQFGHGILKVEHKALGRLYWMVRVAEQDEKSRAAEQRLIDKASDLLNEIYEQTGERAQLIIK